MFGHANSGVFQTDEGPTDAEDPYFAAGVDTDLVSTLTAVRFFGEYLPVLDIDDMRLLILGGCYTANEHPRCGSFNDMPVRRGVDAVVTFPELVLPSKHHRHPGIPDKLLWQLLLVPL